MSANVVRLYSGPESVKAVDAYRSAIQERRDQWPYVHIYPPPNALDVLAVGSVVTQAIGAAAVAVVTYQVNSGKRFYLQAVLLDVTSTMVPGQALFTIDRNSPIGIANSQYMPEHGLVNIPIPLGDSKVAPWRLQRAREFAAGDTIRIKAVNVALSSGDPNYYVCGLFGYEIPVLDVKANR